MPITKSYQLHNSVSRGFNWGKAEHFLIPKIFYELFYFPLKAVFKIFFHLKVESKEDLSNLEGPLVVVSSHASWVDPFLVGMAFPFLTKAAPIHYATWWKYYYFPPFTTLIWLFGGFPVRKGMGLDKALAAPLKILDSGGIVGIFPAGKRTRKWNESLKPKAKRGAAFLAVKEKVKVLPVKIEGNIGMNFKNFLFGKYKIKIKIGKAFSLPKTDLNDPENLNSPSDLIMKRIVSL